jgi:myo-inositol 2-dehydrogenase/D-chiro-inositol 1-dehydrogenase
VNPIGVAIIGTGWCGGIRAEACAAHPLVKSLHLAEVRPERLEEMRQATGAASAVTDYRELLGIEEIAVAYVCATPETTHFPSRAIGSPRAGTCSSRSRLR